MNSKPTPKPNRLITQSLNLLFADGYRAALILCVLAYVVIFTGLAWNFHAGMRTHKADLGQIDQAIWNSSQGRFLQSTEQEVTSTRMTDHVEPIFVLISPIYWLWNDVRALLLLQVMAVAAGAFFVYALALDKLDQLVAESKRALIWHREPLRQLTRPIALALAVAYLLAPQLQSVLLTEVHAVAFGVPLILWAFWAVERRRWAQFILAALLVAAVKEEMALLAAGLGVWAMWRAVVMNNAQWTMHNGPTAQSTNQPINQSTNQSTNRLTPSPLHPFTPSLLPGLLVTVAGLAWFYLATFMIVPHFAGAWYGVADSTYFQRYGALGNSPVDIFKSFITQPGLVLQISLEPARREYVLGLLAAFGFFSLLAPEILLLCLPVLLANSLSAFPAQYYSQFHYDAPIVPFVAVSALYGAARLWRFAARRITGSSASFQHLPAASPAKMALMAFARNAGSSVRPLLAVGLILWTLVWAGGVYAQSGRGPLGGNLDPTPVTAHHRLLDRFTAQIPADAPLSATAAVHPHVSHRQFVYQFPQGLTAPTHPATWALIDVTTNTDMAPGDVKATVDALLAADWGVVDAADGFLLLAKDAPNKTIPDPFYDFARNGENAQWTMDNAQWVDFGPIGAAGVQIEDWPRWRQTKVTTLWTVADDYVPGSVRPWLEIRTPGGDTVYTFDQIAAPALVWYPPPRWQPGETVRITTLWLFLPRTWGAIVGAVHGPDPAQSADRLPIQRQKDETVGVATFDHSLALIAAYQRRAQTTAPIFPTSPAVTWTAPAPVRATFTLPDGSPLAFTGGLADPTLRPGQPLDIWLSWGQDNRLPPGLVPFIHLRHDGQTLAQSDGPPRFFVAGPTLPVDWRQLTAPVDAPPGDWQIVIGLYTPATGDRATLLGADGQPAGTELIIARPTLAPALVPDQACALIPATCGSQLP